MGFNLKKPCAMCPFRTDSLKGWLGENRAEEIADSITRLQQSFPCHETTGAKGKVPASGEQHCAGALILLEKIEQPNQMMRIAERFGKYDRNALDMDAPVFDEVECFIDHHAA